MTRFPGNDIISLVGEAPRHDLAESLGPNLQLADLLGGEVPGSLGNLPLAYGTAQGDLPLREAIAARHGVDAQDVVLTVGGMHALFLLAFILCERGDEAVVATPLFPLAHSALQAVGAQVRTLPLRFDRGYRLDPAALAALLSPRTRLVSLASPQNPSGVALPATVLRDVLAAMHERCPQALLLVDETYREAVYGSDAVASSALALGPRVVSVASLSKCHGAPGLRLGWAITRDAALRRQLVLGKFSTVISCSPLDEALALRLLQQDGHAAAARRARLAQGLAATAAWVQANQARVEWVRPDAGALCCVRLKPAVFDDAAVGRFHDALVRRGARVAPGDWFGDERRVFRLGFGLPDAAGLQAGLAALGEALEQALAPPPA